jgi:two-component system OmpR family response regulator
MLFTRRANGWNDTCEGEFLGMETRLKTYIVEDNLTIRENLVGTLEELTCIETIGYAEAESEARTWLAAHRDEWELAIIDLFLKQGSGLGVLQECAARQPHQKVVVLSNYATPDIRKRCAQLGVDAVFDKSNEIDALIDFCIAQAAARQASRDAH